jgi:hypothetical protein
MSKWGTLKTPPRKVAGTAVLLALAFLPRPTHAAPASSGNTVRGFYDPLLGTMKNGRTLGQTRSEVS